MCFFLQHFWLQSVVIYRLCLVYFCGYLYCDWWSGSFSWIKNFLILEYLSYFMCSPIGCWLYTVTVGYFYALFFYHLVYFKTKWTSSLGRNILLFQDKQRKIRIEQQRIVSKGDYLVIISIGTPEGAYHKWLGQLLWVKEISSSVRKFANSLRPDTKKFCCRLHQKRDATLVLSLATDWDTVS